MILGGYMEDLTVTVTVSMDDIKRHLGSINDAKIGRFLDETDAVKGLEYLLDEAYDTWLDNLSQYNEE